MVINTGNCFNMIISPYIRKWADANNSNCCAFLGIATLVNVTSMRILGVDFSNNLSWVTLSDNVRRKMNCMIGVLKKYGRTTNIDVRLKIYNSITAPHLNNQLSSGVEISAKNICQKYLPMLSSTVFSGCCDTFSLILLHISLGQLTVNCVSVISAMLWPCDVLFISFVADSKKCWAISYILTIAL